MNEITLLVGVVNLTTLGLVALVCIPLVLGRVERNSYYGFRFSESQASDAAWLAINRRGGARMISWSLLLMAAQVVFLVRGIEPNTNEFWLAVMSPVALVIPALTTWLWARQPHPEWQTQPSDTPEVPR